jgi:benzodiazapine receptor
MNNFSWYADIVKPAFAPPAWLFGPVWTVLYILIAISFGKVLQMLFKGEISFWIALPFILNIIFNLAYTPLQTGGASFILPTIDILLVLGTLIWAMIVIFPIAPWITYINIPYLAWVSFATVLQISILVLN